jgi:hypothetical protein
LGLIFFKLCGSKTAPLQLTQVLKKVELVKSMPKLLSQRPANKYIVMLAKGKKESDGGAAPRA